MLFGDGQRGRGSCFHTICPCFSAFLKKKRDIFLTQTESRHGKFQRILSNLENRYKMVTSGRLAHVAMTTYSTLKNSEVRYFTQSQ